VGAGLKKASKKGPWRTAEGEGRVRERKGGPPDSKKNKGEAVVRTKLRPHEKRQAETKGGSGGGRVEP